MALECTLAVIAELAKRPNVVPGDVLYIRTEVCALYTDEQVMSAKQCLRDFGIGWRFVGPARPPECVNDLPVKIRPNMKRRP